MAQEVGVSRDEEVATDRPCPPPPPPPALGGVANSFWAPRPAVGHSVAELQEQAHAAALSRLQNAADVHRRTLETVDELQKDNTFSKEEADAEREKLEKRRAAAKTTYQQCVQRIEVGDQQALRELLYELGEPLPLPSPAVAAPADSAPKKQAKRKTPAASPASSLGVAGGKESLSFTAVRDGTQVVQSQAEALRDLRVKQLQARVDEAARALQAATEGDPELVAFEQRLQQLAIEEKNKGPGKHFTSLTWRKACVAMVELFGFGVRKAARKMSSLLDEDGAPCSWEKQFANLKNWRRCYAAGKLGAKNALLDDDVVFDKAPEDRRVVRCRAEGCLPGPKRMYGDLERQLKVWIEDCIKKKQPLTRAMVVCLLDVLFLCSPHTRACSAQHPAGKTDHCMLAQVLEEAIQREPKMFGGRDSEGWSVKMSRWYYKFLAREDVSVGKAGMDADADGHAESGAPRAKRAKRQSVRYNEAQQRKLESFLVMGRDRINFDQVAEEVSGLDGGRPVTRDNVAQWFTSKLKNLAVAVSASQAVHAGHSAPQVQAQGHAVPAGAAAVASGPPVFAFPHSAAPLSRMQHRPHSAVTDANGLIQALPGLQQGSFSGSVATLDPRYALPQGGPALAAAGLPRFDSPTQSTEALRTRENL